MKVDHEAHHALVEILEGSPWKVRKALLDLLPKLTVTDIEVPLENAPMGQNDANKGTLERRQEFRKNNYPEYSGPPTI